ncbi:MAG: carboxymuconolactone decarboxylase family protein [Candidatus Acidiferrales bacterium]|jgi:4-carboxymuconolactone decarboxylase
MKHWVKWASCMAIVCAGLALATPPTKVYSDDKQPRLPQITVDQLNDQQKPLADEILKVSKIGLRGPNNSMLRSPVMGDRLFKLIDYLRFNTSVPRRLNEFAILIQARLWTSQIEWVAHEPLALKEGLSRSTIDALKQGKRPASMQPDEGAVYDFCMELSTKHEVSDATYKRLREIFTEQQVVDLVAVNGTYVTLAMFLDAAEEGLPAGTPPALKPMRVR